MSEPTIEIAVIIKHKTDNAWLCDLGDVQKWIPKSVIKDYSLDETSIFIAEWYALQEKIIS